VEGLKLAPDIDPIEKIKDLEAQIGKFKTFLNTNIEGSHGTALLRNKLYEHQIAPGSSATPSNLINLITSPTPLASSSANRQGSDVGGKSLTHSSLALAEVITPESLETQFRSTSGSPDFQNGIKPSGAFVDLLFSGWDPDLPDPNTLNH
jgi:hypothetical protein